MGEWQIHPLSTFVDAERSICYGIVQPGSPVDNGIPIVRVNNFRDGGLDTRDVLKVDQSIEANYTRSRLHGNEILLTLVGTMGLTAIVPEALRGWNIARAVGMIPLRSDADKRWINFVLRSSSVQDFIKVHANTTVQATFNLRDLARLPIPLPPASIRASMTTLLSALDDKIELNRRMNATLEAMARALFKDWFVDFGPTRAKAEGRPPYLAPDLWALFPDALDDDDKPAGWEFSTLEAVASLNPETWSRATAPEDIDYVDLANTKWGAIESTQRHAWAKAPSRAQRILRPGDTIVGTVRPGNGSYAFVGGDGLTGSTGFAVLRPLHSRFREFVYLAATSAENIERLSHLADGAAYPAVRPDVVAETGVILPTDKSVMDNFSRVVAPLVERWEANKRECQTLAKTRDLLLPKLMSGEIRLREAEQAVEAVA